MIDWIINERSIAHEGLYSRFLEYTSGYVRRAYIERKLDSLFRIHIILVKFQICPSHALRCWDCYLEFDLITFFMINFLWGTVKKQFIITASVTTKYLVKYCNVDFSCLFFRISIKLVFDWRAHWLFFSNFASSFL